MLAGIWLLVTTLLGWLSGWFTLQEVYPDRSEEPLERLRFQSARLGRRGGLPVNLKCVFESAEEVGSPGLPEFLAGNRRTLAADGAVLSDTRMLGPGQPALTYSLRGSLSCAVEARALGHEVHSGGFGGAVRNPVQELARLLAGLQDRDGRIAIRGFYENVRPVGAEERRFMASQGPPDAVILAEASTPAPAGFSSKERGRRWVLPRRADRAQLEDLAEDVPAPCPALVTVGRTDPSGLLSKMFSRARFRSASRSAG